MLQTPQLAMDSSFERLVGQSDIYDSTHWYRGVTSVQGTVLGTRAASTQVESLCSKSLERNRDCK